MNERMYRVMAVARSIIASLSQSHGKMKREQWMAVSQRVDMAMIFMRRGMDLSSRKLFMYGPRRG